MCLNSVYVNLFKEVRRLNRKVTKMGKALKKLGLMEDAEGEFVDPRTTVTPPSTNNNNNNNNHNDDDN